MARVYAVVAAAGKSTRMGGVNKQLLPLSGIPVLIRSLYALDRVPEVLGIILVASPDNVLEFREATARWGLEKVIAVVPGGENRQQSVFSGLLAVPFDCEIVLVHDGARPLVTRKEIKDLIAAVVDFGAATLAVPVKDTVKEASPDGFVAGTPDRYKLWLTLTPQGFSFGLLLAAHRLAGEKGVLHTDDASLVEAYGGRVKIVGGSYGNIKITTPE
ncbi:MAG: 2-C-methyl-D-erythritol 4-phosphate cytidylyltransferase, partial [Firmicutes bacterium]|nr:2-C-methyl-D-erythritol 4-phosphate cytidylyltransferase [Bacillota bacterium]